MVEETLATFETFCAHQDVATLAADQEHISQYEAIVRIYADFAVQYSSPLKGSTPPSVALRWRSAGLQALQSVTLSEAVGADGGTQLNIIMPLILQNLHPENGEYLAILQQRSQADETEDKESARRRMSIATVRTTDTALETHSGILPGLAEDADRLAEEEVALQALKCLKQIFVTSNRAQVRMATAAMLRFICGSVLCESPDAGQITRSRSSRNWTTTLMELAARWTPVQDRFVVLVTVVETLIRSAVVEENLDQQLVLATIVGWLLRSNTNMIGLSVMDVLLGLVQHILHLLQLGGKGSNVLPHHQQTDAVDLYQDTNGLVNRSLANGNAEKLGPKIESLPPSTNRLELLAKLQRCIGDLGTHVYYSDQISDIIAAILLHLNPSPTPGVSTIAAALGKTKSGTLVVSNSAKLQENPDADDFFSSGTARLTALKAIKEVLIVANKKGNAGNVGAVGRNRVSVKPWEGTQWLLRDDDRRVRKAYVDALLTWLRLEMSKNDLRVVEDKRKTFRAPSKPNDESNGWGHTTKRTVTTVSQREKTTKPARSKYLQFLHLAIYDNAIESPDSEADVLLLHLLMTTLVDKLGVNAATSGIPMIIRLQEDMNINQFISTPTAKLNIGSLVHGYFWALSVKFDFGSSRVGFDIHNEISRRRSLGLWLESIQLPPLPLDQITSVSSQPCHELPLSPLLQKEPLKSFDSRPAMVEQIATAYASSLASGPNSPPNSPGRVFSMPILSNPEQHSSSESELPSPVKIAMLADWSKEICLATIEEENNRTVSLNGSRTGTNLSVRQRHLTINGRSTRNGSPNGAHSPNRTSPLSQNGNNNDPSPGHGLSFSTHDNLHIRLSSAHDSNSPSPISSSDHNQTLRVDDLKRVLAGGPFGTHTRGASPLRNTTSRRDFVTSSDHHSISTGSESAVSFESASEGTSMRSTPPVQANSAMPGKRNASIGNNHDSAAVFARPQTSRPHSLRKDSFDQNRTSRPHSLRQDSFDQNRNSYPHSLRRNSLDQARLPTRSSLRPSSSSSSATEDPTANAKALRGDFVLSLPSATGNSVDYDVPPVPPLPASVVVNRNVPVGGLGGGEVRPVSRGFGGERTRTAADGNLRKKRGVDIGALLGSIDAVAGKGKSSGLSLGQGQPPY